VRGRLPIYSILVRVLVTGVCGWTAAAIVEALHQAGHEVVGIDLPGVPLHDESLPVEIRRLDVADFDALLAVAESCEAVVHLAVAIAPGDYDRPAIPFRTNVLGAYTVFEAARRVGMRRVVALGSAPVHQPASDDSLYDLTKSLQEKIADEICAAHDMSVLTLRAGHIVDGRAGCDPLGTPLEKLEYCRGGWVCRYDVARAVVAGLGWKGGGHEVLDVIGARAARDRFDVDRTEAVLDIRLETDFAGF
jgi:nucleoside-diphosphate-sugar epimerase